MVYYVWCIMRDIWCMSDVWCSMYDVLCVVCM